MGREERRLTTAGKREASRRVEQLRDDSSTTGSRGRNQVRVPILTIVESGGEGSIIDAESAGNEEHSILFDDIVRFVIRLKRDESELLDAGSSCESVVVEVGPCLSVPVGEVRGSRSRLSGDEELVEVLVIGGESSSGTRKIGGGTDAAPGRVLEVPLCNVSG